MYKRQVLDFVRKFFRLEVYQTACVFPVFKDMHNGIGRPLALIAGVVAAGEMCIRDRSSSSVPFRVSNVIVQSLSSPKLVRTCLSSQVPNVYVAGLV